MATVKKSASTKSPQKRTQKEDRAERALLPVLHAGHDFSPKHHVFISKLKRGELWALNFLPAAQKGIITPLFEMLPPSIPRATKPKAGKPARPARPAKSLATHSKDVLSAVLSDWGRMPFFLDTSYVPAGGIPAPESARMIFEVARELQLACVPVTALRFAAAYQAQIADIAAIDGRGALLRLRIQDFVDPNLIADYLSSISQVLRLKRDQIDILIDLTHRTERVVVSQLGSSSLSALPFIDEWRTITLAAGCFPPNITSLAYDRWSTLERSDWLGWNDVRTSRALTRKRQASHGDYGIRCGGEPLFVPNTPAPNLRYTVAANVLVRKGKKEDGRIKEICASLIARPEFSGADFSEGDRQISQRAAMPGSPNNGQAEQWIQWCTNHHLAFVASQILSLPVA